MLLAISDEPFSLYRPRSDWRPRPEFRSGRLKLPRAAGGGFCVDPALEGEPSQVTEAVDAGKKLKVKIKT